MLDTNNQILILPLPTPALPQTVQEQLIDVTVEVFPPASLDVNEDIDRNALIEDNLLLVESRIKLVNGVNINNREDILQAGRLGLCKAAQGYNKDLGVQFSTYAVHAIDNEMHRAVQACYDKCNPVSFNNVLELEYDLTGEGLLYADPSTTSPEYICEQKLAEDMLPNLIPLYPPAHRPAILALVMRTEGYTKNEIVTSLGLNAKTYRCKIHNTVNRIKKDGVFMQYVEGLGYKRMNTA